MRRRTMTILLLVGLLGLALGGCSRSETTGTVKTTFDVEGMTCGSCEVGITGTLLGMDGVDEATATHSTGKVDVVFDAARATPEEMAAAIDRLGYTTKGWTPPE